MHSNLQNEDVSTKRRRIARLAEQSPELGFTSLNHLIDIDWLREAFRLTPTFGNLSAAGYVMAWCDASSANG